MDVEPLTAEHAIPRLIEASGDPTAWAAEHGRVIQDLVSRTGAVLIRGLRIDTAEAFRKACEGVEPALHSYTGGDSPRTGLADKVYTSTEYDAALEVFLHNELSYAGWSPRLVFFGCLLPAAEGGETQIADGREIYAAMPAAIRDRFERRGVAYLQHLWDADGEPGIGKSWQETFETGDRDEVEAYLRRSGMEWEWTGFGLRTRARHDAVVRHPVTGEKCWWTQADQWHRAIAGVKTSFGGAKDARIDPATAGEETLGNHVTYGDGGEIAVADLEAVRRVNRSCEVTFPWHAGDIMLLDNVLTMHGRKPYRGERRVVVAMA